MPRKSPIIRPAARAAAVALAAVMLAGCQTSRELMGQLAPPARQVQAQQPATYAEADLALVGQALDAPPAGRADLLSTAEKAYQAGEGPRQTLRYALLLAASDPPTSDLEQAQTLLAGLLADPHPSLEPPEQTLARLELVLITRQLTLRTENRTLRSTGAQKLADLDHQLHSAAQQNLSLKRQLDEARAKLAAITNIEKSMNEGKLGNEGPP